MLLIALPGRHMSASPLHDIDRALAGMFCSITMLESIQACCDYISDLSHGVQK
jgi:hypothetical protein